MNALIQFETKKCQYGQLGYITLNRPQALNALNMEMILVLDEILEKCEKDFDIMGIVVQSASEKAFCAGGDIRAMYEGGLKKDPQVLTFFEREYQLNRRIHHFSKPYISLLNGITMGGGVGISLHGSHCVAGENFKFAMPETAIGFFPDIGGSHLLHQCPGSYGVYLGLTGARLNREDAHALNLLDYCIDVNRQPEMIAQLHELDLREQAKSKISELLRHYHVEPVSETIFHHSPWINEIFSETSVEKIIEQLEKKAKDNPDIAKTLADLKVRSPMSLKVTLEQFKRTQFESLDDCLKMDYQLVQHFLKGHDLYEGVRALIVDKDNQPKWNPSILENVSEEMVSLYFK